MVSTDKTVLLLTKVHCLFNENCYVIILQAVLVTFLMEYHFWKIQLDKHNMATQLWVLGRHYLINEQYSESVASGKRTDSICCWVGKAHVFLASLVYWHHNHQTHSTSGCQACVGFSHTKQFSVTLVQCPSI